jgi:hypothetical protein
MDDNEKVFKELVLTVQSKFPKMIFEKASMDIGMIDDDFIRNQLTCLMKASVYEWSNPTQTVYKTLPAPSFLDWLLRRKKTVAIEVDCKEILVEPPVKSDNCYFYEARIKQPE